MIYVLYTLFVLSCVVLILSVLLQPGKADAGALFTSSVSSAAFGPRGTQTLLAKISIVAAVVFMLTALMISMGVGGYHSVVSSEDSSTAPAATPAATPAAPAGAEEPSALTPADLENALPAETAPAAEANTATGKNANAAGAASASGTANRTVGSNRASAPAANTR